MGYPKLRPCEALCRCLDPSAGDWEDIEPPEPGEWLESQLDKTPDQSFETFAASRPNVPDRGRRTIYLQPLCDVAELQQAPFPEGPWPSWAVLEQVVRVFYAPLQVVALPAVPMSSLRPKPQSRKNDYGSQYNARQVLDALKQLSVPKDAYCTLAVTMLDLYPRDDWNFVYGLASLSERVGVFSFIRHTPDQQKPPAVREGEMLHDSMKTMLHEIGHMFGLKHCTFFNCLMRGNNGKGIEHQPNYLHLCPVCLRKLHSSTGFDVPEHYAGLLRNFEPYEATAAGFQRDCEFLRRRLAALQDLPPNATVDRKRALALLDGSGLARLGSGADRGGASCGGIAAERRRASSLRAPQRPSSDNDGKAAAGAAPTAGRRTTRAGGRPPRQQSSRRAAASEAAVSLATSRLRQP